jgi:hypothetical protein
MSCVGDGPHGFFVHEVDVAQGFLVHATAYERLFRYAITNNPAGVA